MFFNSPFEFSQQLSETVRYLHGPTGVPAARDAV